MYYNEPYYNNNNAFYPQTGYGFAQQPKPKYTQPLTPEQISKLRSNDGVFKIEVGQEDLWRAACTHKDNGETTLVSEGVDPNTNEEILRCTICGETFRMSSASKEAVQEAVDVITDMLQTSKTIYLDAPPELIKQYYQILPLLKKLPVLWERAQNNFQMYERAFTQATPNNVGSGFNGFQMMNSMLANPYAAYGNNGQSMHYQQSPMGQPMYQGQAPMGQPMQYQQPMYQPQAPMGQQMYQGQAPMGQPNPFVYGAPMAPVPAPAPGVVPPVAPVASAPIEQHAGEVTQQKTFNV